MVVGTSITHLPLGAPGTRHSMLEGDGWVASGSISYARGTSSNSAGVLSFLSVGVNFTGR